jgi:molybdopterin converting factor small subunit
MIPIKVLLFGPLRERVGQAQLDSYVGEGRTAAEVLDGLVAEHEVLRPYRGVLRVAINGTYAPLEAVLRPGDELALITPTSGG